MTNTDYTDKKTQINTDVMLNLFQHLTVMRPRNKFGVTLCVIFNFTFLIFNCLYGEVSGAKFLELQPSVRALAVGDVAASISGEASLLLSNPANTVFATKNGFSVLYNSYIQDIYQGMVSGVFLFQGWASGLSYSQLGMKDEPVYDESGNETGKKFGYGGNVLSGNVSMLVNKNLSIGLNIKSIGEEIGTYSKNTIGFDTGLGLKVDFLQFGLSYLNIGKIGQWSLPAALRAGASATKKELTVCSDYILRTVDNKSEIGIGAEYIISEVLTPRVGYKFAKERSGITAGIGLKLKSIALDYAFVPSESFGNTHNFELLIAFSPERKKPVAPAGRPSVAEIPAEVQKPLPKSVQAKPLTAKPTIAVLKLAARGVSAQDATAISELLRTAIINTETFSVIKDRSLKQVLQVLQLEQTDCIDEECAVKIGGMLDVQKVIVGTVGKVGSGYIINVRVIDVGTGKIKYTDNEGAEKPEELKSAVDRLANRISQNIK